jgi:uncharacterized protein
MGVPNEPWIDRLKDDLWEITSEAARELWPGPTPDHPPYFNYRWEHTQQVERDSQRLLHVVGGDEDVVMAAVWVHDRFQPQYVDDNHAEQAEAWAREGLPTLGFPQEKVEAVCYAIANHSSPPGAIPLAEHDAQLLWDADKLSKIGATSILAYLCAIPAFPQHVIGFEEIAHYGMSRLSWAKDLSSVFYFEPSKKIAQRRFEIQRLFYEQLQEEVVL